MNLPNYIDLDQEYFIEKARYFMGRDNSQPEVWIHIVKLAFEIWSDYQKFFHQTVFEGMFVPCSECSECGGLGFVHAGDSDDDIKCEYCEQSGKPLEKPEGYNNWINHEKGYDYKKEYGLFNEAEQRTLFTGWELHGVRMRGVHSAIGRGLRVIDFQDELKADFPLNESNKTIQKLFLSEVKV